MLLVPINYASYGKQFVYTYLDQPIYCLFPYPYYQVIESTEFPLLQNLSWINGITHIMAFPICHMCDQVDRLAAILHIEPVTDI